MLKHRVTSSSSKGGTRSRSGSRQEQNRIPLKAGSLPDQTRNLQQAGGPRPEQTGKAQQNDVQSVTDGAFNNVPVYRSPEKVIKRRVSLKERRFSSSQRRSLVLNGDAVDSSIKNFHRLSLSEECILPKVMTSTVASTMTSSMTSAVSSGNSRKHSMERIGRVLSSSPIHIPRTSPPTSPSTMCASVSFSDIVMFEQFREGVTEQDLLQVETFYHSHMSEVYVCACLVNLYLGSIKTVLNKDQWSFTYTGIPLLLLDSGAHLRERKLSIILAEKGTGFTLWRDVIDHKTGYKTPNPNFHTLHTSKDHSKLVGLSFDEAKAAAEFYSHIKRLTFDPDDELLLPENSPKRRPGSMRDRKRRGRLPQKSEISNPCCFVHVTRLEPETLDSEGDSAIKSDPNEPVEISAPFNFQHVTATSQTGSDVITTPSMTGSDEAVLSVSIGAGNSAVISQSNSTSTVKPTD